MMEKDQIGNIDKTLIPWIGRIAKLFGSINQEVFKKKKVGINKEQLLVLKHLMMRNGLVQSDLAMITERDKTTLTRLINKMEAKGWVERVASENDHRCKRIFITDLGKEKYEKIYPILIKNALHVQEDLNEKELENTIKVLKKVTQNLKEKYNEIK